MLEQTTKVLLFPHSPFCCRPWTHILLPPNLSRLALFPNVNAIFAVRECCNWILICLKEIGQVISVLHEPHPPCCSGRAGGWRMSFSLSHHTPRFFSASSCGNSFTPLWWPFLFWGFFDGLFPFCGWQAYPSLFSFCSFLTSLFEAFENNFGWRLLQETQSEPKTARKTNKKS